MLDQKLAQFVHKALSTAPHKENAKSVHDDIKNPVIIQESLSIVYQIIIAFNSIHIKTKKENNIILISRILIC